MTANLTQAQVDYFISIATGMGIPPAEVPALWRKHMDWCDGNMREPEYGGTRWVKFCETNVRFIKERLAGAGALNEKEAQRAAEMAATAALERKARDSADAEYATEAVSLTTWLASLRDQAASGELLEPHEAHLAREEPPPGYEEAGAWLMEAMAGFKTFDGKKPERPSPCGVCGLPTRRWVGPNGRVYRSGTCVDHERGFGK